MANLVDERLAVLENAHTSSEAAEEEPEEVLAQKASTSGTFGRMPVAHSQASIAPNYYVHIPKCGSSFATSIAHTTCGDAIPQFVSVKEPNVFKKKWAAMCPMENFARFKSGHHPLDRQLDRAKLANVVTIMRNPLQRIISGYYVKTGLHDCPALRKRYHCRAGRCEGDYKVDGVWLRNTSVIPPIEYAKCVENCASQLLTGNHCNSDKPVDRGLLLRNIQDIGFVGLTEEWALSVCLWHTKYGGDILPVEFANLRQGVVRHPHGYDVEKYLGDWRPSVDMLAYRAAVDRFFAEVKKYGLTRKSCAQRYKSVSDAFEASVMFVET